MRIYDVEVLGVEIENKDIAAELAASQREVIRHTLTIASSRRGLEFVKESESVRQQTDEAKQVTARALAKLAQEQIEDKLAVDMARIAAAARTATEEQTVSLAGEKYRSNLLEEVLGQQRAKAQQEAAIDQVKLDQRKAWLEAEVRAVVDKAGAVDPALVAALTAFGEQNMIEKVSEAMAPLAMISRTGVMEVVGELLKGTKLGDRLLPAPKNGAVKASGESVPRS